MRLLDLESDLDDARRLDSSVQNLLRVGRKVRLTDAVESVHEAEKRRLMLGKWTGDNLDSQRDGTVQ